jgi:hypothetical protein
METAKIRMALNFIDEQLKKLETEQQKTRKPKPKRLERVSKYQLMFHSKTQTHE